MNSSTDRSTATAYLFDYDRERIHSGNPTLLDRPHHQRSPSIHSRFVPQVFARWCPPSRRCSNRRAPGMDKRRCPRRVRARSPPARQDHLNVYRIPCSAVVAAAKGKPRRDDTALPSTAARTDTCPDESPPPSRSITAGKADGIRSQAGHKPAAKLHASSRPLRADSGASNSRRRGHQVVRQPRSESTVGLVA